MFSTELFKIKFVSPEVTLSIILSLRDPKMNIEIIINIIPSMELIILKIGVLPILALTNWSKFSVISLIMSSSSKSLTGLSNSFSSFGVLIIKFSSIGVSSVFTECFLLNYSK